MYLRHLTRDSWVVNGSMYREHSKSAHVNFSSCGRDASKHRNAAELENRRLESSSVSEKNLAKKFEREGRDRWLGWIHLRPLGKEYICGVVIELTIASTILFSEVE